ncbi:hypothetical protein, partial [Streptomyces globisporus]|uniref:hypothetical protein n=1 Tax=Streptomyces globisporus TaxID=1908 RepID=UPI00370314CD
TSSAITSGASPVIRWLRMIAARVRLPTTRTMINDQGLDALPPTMHEVVRPCGGKTVRALIPR